MLDKVSTPMAHRQKRLLWLSAELIFGLRSFITEETAVELWVNVCINLQLCFRSVLIAWDFCPLCCSRNLQAAIGAYYDFESPNINAPCMSFVNDVTIGEGESVPPDTPFTKTWRIQNTGKSASLMITISYDSGLTI